jgi:Ase1/PRC1/MAP65 family protein
MLYREKDKMTQEAQRLITSIQQMEASLGDERANGQYELNRDDLRITYPLIRCISFLREKNEAMAKLHRERFEQVKSELYRTHRSRSVDDANFK